MRTTLNELAGQQHNRRYRHHYRKFELYLDGCSSNVQHRTTLDRPNTTSGEPLTCINDL